MPKLHALLQQRLTTPVEPDNAVVTRNACHHPEAGEMRARGLQMAGKAIDAAEVTWHVAPT